jgi:putative NADH-flavin reductase
MRLAIIAANGRLGSEVVKAAIEAGHSVTAGVRGAHSLAEHPNLRVMTCDATDARDLEALLRGQDAVVSAIGHVKGSASDVQTVATKIVISIMSKLGIQRFVDVTGTGVRFQGDKITFLDRFLNTGVEMIDHNRMQDGRNHQEVLKASTLEWTTIRVLKLQPVASKPYTLRLHGPTKPFVSRVDVAQAIIEVLEQHSYVRQSPIIGNV